MVRKSLVPRKSIDKLRVGSVHAGQDKRVYYVAWSGASKTTKVWRLKHLGKNTKPKTKKVAKKVAKKAPKKVAKRAPKKVGKPAKSRLRGGDDDAPKPRLDDHIESLLCALTVVNPDFEGDFDLRRIVGMLALNLQDTIQEYFTLSKDGCEGAASDNELKTCITKLIKVLHQKANKQSAFQEDDLGPQYAEILSKQYQRIDALQKLA